MATISKFYLHDATTPNTGTMPSGAIRSDLFGGTATTGDATGARTARAANDTIGVANPDTESTFTSVGNTTLQLWGHRRFVSAPLAAQTINFNSTAWTFSYARTESNLLHNQSVQLTIYVWRPSTGAQVGTNAQGQLLAGTEPTVAAAEQAESVTSPTGTAVDVAIADGDILVFDISSGFTQGMATAYTEQFAYDGTTEASTTTCASFITPPSALTLFASAQLPAHPVKTMLQAVQRTSTWMRRHSGVVVPRLWTPADTVGA